MNFPAQLTSGTERGRLGELAGLFLKLGTTAFGGPAAHIAMMEDEVVRRRHWFTRDEFLDLVGATQLIPGPNSTELAIHIGRRRAGWPGLLVAGVCFILPATLIVMALAWAYVRFGQLPNAAGLLYGIKPVIIAVVVQALWRLGRTALKTRRLALLGLACLAGVLAGMHELLLLAAGGAVMILARGLDSRTDSTSPTPGDSANRGVAGNDNASAGWRSSRAPIAIPLMGLLILTCCIRWLDLDQQLQGSFWSEQDGWRWSAWPAVRFLYDFGTWPALVVGLAGGAAYLATKILGRWQSAQRLGLFLILLLGLGPGLVVNLALKNQVGRPRPAQTQGFGGDKAFVAVGELGPGGAGKSFPSGHATMGFYWVGLFVYFWRDRRSWAWAFGTLGMVYGVLMGLGRIAQGGHWISDVLWSAGVVYVTAWGLHMSMENAPSALTNLFRGRTRRDGTSTPAVSGVVPVLALTNSPVIAPVAAGAVVTAVAAPFGLWPMFLFFLKVGSVLFGSGYVLLAFLRADLVERWHWLSERQLLDAIAVGQFTPGPVFTTATFIGYQLAGVPGAALATVGIFLPAFLFVALSGHLVPRLRRSPSAGAFLDGVNLVSLVLMAVVTWQLASVALSDGLTLALALVSGILLFRFHIHSAWLVLGGAAIGLTVSLFAG